jgi:sulfite exporter TauE/SafE
VTEISLVSAFVMGLLGGVHCVGMCGGIVGALTFGLAEEVRTRPHGALPYQLGYSLGRITSYVIAGAIMGGLGMLLAEILPVYYAQQFLLLIAGFFMLALGLYLGGWWMGLNRLERLGGVIWRRLEPMARKLLPVATPAQAWLLGLVWGWIPCGLVYSMLIWTVSSGGVIEGAGLMLAFGLGTLPNLLVMGLVAGGLARWSRDVRVRRLAGLMVMLFGVYTLWQLL